MPDLPAVESEADSPQQIILEFFVALVRMLSGLPDNVNSDLCAMRGLWHPEAKNGAILFLECHFWLLWAMVHYRLPESRSNSRQIWHF